MLSFPASARVGAGDYVFLMGETLRIEELDVCFGLIHDVALASLSSATFAPIREALLEYGFLVFQVNIFRSTNKHIRSNVRPT